MMEETDRIESALCVLRSRCGSVQHVCPSAWWERGVVTQCRECVLVFFMHTGILHRRSFCPSLGAAKKRWTYTQDGKLERDLSDPLNLARQRDAYGVYKGIIMRELGHDVGTMFCQLAVEVCCELTNRWIISRIMNMRGVPTLYIK